MKDSGIEWLGDVPEHWEMVRLKGHTENVVDLTRESACGDIYLALEHVESWTGRFIAADDDVMFDSQVKRFRAGDVLFGKLRPYLAKVTYPNQSGICVGEFLVLRPVFVNLSPRYLEQLLRSRPVIDAIDASTFGAKMPRADWQFIGDMRIPLPHLPEQTTIVRFLDHVDRRIRRYIRAKQKLIALLEEQKQAIIHQAVTGQIDVRTGQPYPSYKDSGVEWLSDVPEHWEKSKKIKYLSFLKGRLGWQGLKAGEYTNVGPYIVSSAHFSDHKINWEKCPHVTQERYERDENIQLSQGDILLMKDGAAMGKLAFVDKLPGLACLNSHLLLFRPLACDEEPTYFPQFMFYYMQTEYFQGYVQINGTGATFLGISQESVGNHKICLPPYSEQVAIVERLDETTTRLDIAITESRRQINLLREYRTRLIADVVTGKFDVREAAAELPEIDPLAAESDADDTPATDAESDPDDLNIALEEVKA